PDGGVYPSGPVLTGPPAKMKPTQHRKPPAYTRQRLSALGEAYVSMMRGSMTEEGWPGGARPESGRLVEDGQLGVDVEQVDLVLVECDADGIAVTGLGGGRDAGGHLVALVVQVQVDLGAHHFGNLNLSVQLAVGVLCHELGLVVDVLGTDAHLDLLADISVQLAVGGLLLGQGDQVAAQVNCVLVALLGQAAVQEVHLGAADEAGDEHVAGVIVQVLRGIDLLDDAVLHDDDAVAHGHGLGLVMGNVDEGGGQLLVQLDDLGAHAGTQLGVQVGQRLVQQEDGRVTDHGAAQSDTLALAARQSLGLAVQQVLDLQDLGGLMDALVDLVLRGLAQLEAEGDVLVNGHVGVQSVALEDHGDVAVLRGNVVDQTAADVHLALGDLLQAGDHAQGGGLAAAGGADEDDELLIR